MKIPEALTERRFLQYLFGKPSKCVSSFCFSWKPMSMYAGAPKIARYVFFTFGAYHFAASAITKGIFSATKDYASLFDVDVPNKMVLSEDKRRVSKGGMAGTDMQ
ncbi:hypothetical protein H5410_035454 [Solanum commersonii]|uniref:Uncharacterized protein n=1 Tax=Solanum commersonii TaxID=4109 RepID=A0A9J5Y570_SOLCO|nr:hypothetical protein H5410_035454 [Solanum commersonii]